MEMFEKNVRPLLHEPIGVLGYGVEGAGTCRFLLSQGYGDITIFDRKPPLDPDPRVSYDAGRDGNYLAGLASMRTVFRSAGVRPDLPELVEFQRRGGRLTSQIEMAIEIVGTDRIIGVTGTLGKGTCCSLLQAMLAEAGITAALGGNIGVPALDLATSLPPEDKLILELSSFQLSTLSASPAYAAVLKTTSEHLDWHLDQAEYWRHKANITAFQKKKDVLAYHADSPGSAWIAAQSPGRKIGFGKQAPVRLSETEIQWTQRGFSLPLAATRLTGGFNLENLAAAGSLALELGAEPRQILAAAAQFRGLEHRLEFVRRIGAIDFYNDSFATRPDAAMGAIAAFPGSPLGLILGGSDKFADFSELAKAVVLTPNLQSVALIGQTADRLASELKTAEAVHARPVALFKADTLESAVLHLVSTLKTGTVLLSPACASFGMFENYKERGKAFKRLVDGL